MTTYHKDSGAENRTTKQNETCLTIGQRLKAAREAKGMEKLTLSAYSGISVESVGRIELGLQSTKIITLLALCEALGVEVSELLKGIK